MSERWSKEIKEKQKYQSCQNGSFGTSMVALEVRLSFLGFGILLLAAAPFYYRWGKSASKDEWEWRTKIQMYRGLVALIGIGIGIVFIATAALLP